MACTSITGVILISLLGWASAAAAPGEAWKEKKYLLPILRAGPNNQMRHLRFSIALAKQLNRTLIAPGIIKHYTDRGARYKLPKAKVNGGSGADETLPNPLIKQRPSCFKEEVPHNIQLAEILDRDYIQQFVDITTPAELKQAGWDGVIDALIYPNQTLKVERLIPYMSMTVAAAQVHLYHDLAIQTTRDQLRCEQESIAALAKQIRGWRVVLIMFLVIGNHEVANLQQEGLEEPSGPGTNQCWKDLFHANRRLRSNEWMRGVARRYIEQHVGMGGDNRFLAMQVRPQSDQCWRMWMNNNFDEKELNKKGVCWLGHADLHKKVGPKALASMAKHNLTRLLILTHPNLQPMITEMLAKVGLPAMYVDPAAVAAITGCEDSSSTFLALVEMQIAVQAPVFMGTASSSISETVLYERLAMGNSNIEWLDRPFPNKVNELAARERAQVKQSRQAQRDARRDAQQDAKHAQQDAQGQALALLPHQILAHHLAHGSMVNLPKTLQQVAASGAGISASQTQALAQALMNG